MIYCKTTNTKVHFYIVVMGIIKYWMIYSHSAWQWPA